MTARILLVFLVALINLGLGFIVAVHIGRGPWSRYARRSAANHALRAAPTPKAVKSIEQIAVELEGMEHRLQELLQSFSAGSAKSVNLDAIRSTVRSMVAQVEALAADETQEHHEQATTSLHTLLMALQAANADLEHSVENRDNGSRDPVPLLTSLQMACREVSMVFNALLFAELPA